MSGWQSRSSRATTGWCSPASEGGALRALALAVAGACLALHAGGTQPPAPEAAAAAMSPQLAQAELLARQAADLVRARDFEQALRISRRALALTEEAGVQDGTLASRLIDTGAIHARLGQDAEALQLYRRALALQRKLLAPGSAALGDALQRLSLLVSDLNRNREALPLQEQAVAIAEQLHGKDHPLVAERITNLGYLHEGLGDYARAVPLYERALAITKAAHGPEHPSVAVALNHLARSYRIAGRFADALPLARWSLGIAELAHGPDAEETGTALARLATIHLELAQTAEALALFQRALAIAESTEGPDSDTAGARLRDLGYVHKAMGQYAQALPLFERALAISEKVNGRDHGATGSAADSLGGILALMGRWQEALPLYERAVAIAERQRGADHPVTADRLHNLAGLYAAMARHAEALSLYQRALAILERTDGPENPGTAVTLGNLAGLYDTMGQHARALPLHERALAIVEKAYGADHPRTADALASLATAYRSAARYAEALQLHRRAVAISRKVNGPAHPDTGTALSGLAGVYQEMGLYDQALPLYRQALTIAEASKGPEHPDTGGAHHMLGSLHSDMGDFAQALQSYGRGLAIAEKAEGPEHPSTGVSLHSIASVQQTMGLYGQALPTLERALRIAETAEGPEHPSTAYTLLALGELYQSMGQHEQALRLMQRALRIGEASEGSAHPSTATKLSSLASLHTARGESARALPLAQRAVAISEAAYGPDHPQTGTFLNNLALAYADAGQPAPARPLLLRSLAIAERVEGPEHPSTGRTVANLARVETDLGHFEAAEALHLRAMMIAERSGAGPLRAKAQRGYALHLRARYLADPGQSTWRDRAIFVGKLGVNTIQAMRADARGLDKALQKGLAEQNGDIYRRLGEWLIEAGRLAEAEQVLAMLKEHELSELVRSATDPQRSQADFTGGERRAAATQQRLAAQGVQEAAELAALERRMRAGETLDAPAQARRQALLQSAQAWRADYQRFVAGLGGLFADAARGGQATEAAQAQGTRLQSRVARDPEGAVGLHYVVADDRVAIIVSTARASFGRFSTVPRAELNRQIHALRQAILERGDHEPAARALWKTLIAPVQADLQASGAKTLVLSLTDTLRYLPFAALQDDAGRYLVEDYALALWAAAADVAPAPGQGSWQVAALGMTQARPGFKALPAVRGELQGIVRTDANPQGVLPGRIQMDEQFGRDQLEAALSGDANVVHIASHFEFKPGDESRSVLLLGKGEPISLGQLAVLDFSQVDQLTLSACDTATGGGVNENGAEVEGLASAVLRQQARSVLATLWKVADASTADLMRRFYAQRGQPRPPSRAQALRQAQLALLRGGQQGEASAERGAVALAPTGEPRAASATPWSHPYFWAPFVLSGSWL